MINIARLVYKSTSENYEKQTGASLPFEGDVLPYQAKAKHGEFDVAKASFLSNKSFLILAFANLLGRYPNEDAFAVFSSDMATSKPDFQKKVLVHIISSAEHAKMNKRAINSPDIGFARGLYERSIKKPGLKYKLKTMLYRIYSKLPQGLRSFAKKTYFSFRGWDFI